MRCVLFSSVYNTILSRSLAIKAAEALGALSAESAKPLLEKYLTCPERAVRETCEIALDKIKWDATPEGQAANQKAREAKAQGTA